MSNNEGKEELLALFEDAKEFVEKLDDVEKYVAILEGFPIVFTGFNEEEAESVAAMAVDVMSAGTTFAVGENKNVAFKEILAVMDENRVIDIAKVREAIILLEGKREPVESTMSVVLRYINGERIRCPWCGADLTLEVYKCPRCGATIPFASSRCPHCGADVSIKSCVKCNNLIDINNMKKVVKKIIKNKNYIASEAGLGGLITGLLAFMFTENPLASVIAGIVGGGITWFIADKNAPVEEKIEEI